MNIGCKCVFVFFYSFILSLCFTFSARRRVRFSHEEVYLFHRALGVDVVPATGEICLGERRGCEGGGYGRPDENMMTKSGLFYFPCSSYPNVPIRPSDTCSQWSGKGRIEHIQNIIIFITGMEPWHHSEERRTLTSSTSIASEREEQGVSKEGACCCCCYCCRH